MQENPASTHPWNNIDSVVIQRLSWRQISIESTSFQCFVPAGEVLVLLVEANIVLQMWLFSIVLII